jgi:hypothetical protein
VPMLVAPVFLFSLFGITLDPKGVYPAWEYASSMMGNMLINWFARNAVESEARRAIVIGLCVYDAVGFVMTLIALLTGMAGPTLWLAAAIYLFFALGYGYFLLPQKKTA